jgi:hypothetical protein
MGYRRASDKERELWPESETDLQGFLAASSGGEITIIRHDDGGGHYYELHAPDGFKFTGTGTHAVCSIYSLDEARGYTDVEACTGCDWCEEDA